MTKLHNRNPSGPRRNPLRQALLGSVACAAWAGLSGTAIAQDTSMGAQEADEEFGENVILVQARKQTETLQEVPVTITSVGAETLEKYGVDQVADIMSRVPTLNVQVGGSGSGGQLSLRGVGSSNISAAFDSAVAFDFDGVQISTMRMVQTGFFDTQQIDVLKGPQSLFFGKSASAGVFSVRSADPTSTWQIGAKASYEFEEEGYTVNGFISGPLTDTLGIRLAAQYNDIKEVLELQDGTPAVNGRYRGETNFVGRMTLDWEPFDGFNANLKVQYFKNENDGAIGHSDLDCGANGVADSVYLLLGALQIPGGYDCNAFDGKYFLPDTAPPLAVSVPTASGPTKALGFNGVPFGETDLWFARLLLEFALTDTLDLVMTTGFVDLDATDVDNYSYGGLLAPGVPGGAGTSDPRNTLKQYTQEIRLSSDLDGPFNFLVGGFYEWRKFLFDTSQQGVNISFAGPDPVTGFTFDWDKAQETKTEAFSLFGSAIINLTDKLELSGGVRWTDEKKVSRISVPYVHTFLAVTPAFIDSGFFSGPIDFKDSNWSPEVTLKYQANDDLNFFASFKTGFKSGGIDNSALPSNSLLGFDDPDPAVREATAAGLIFKSETAMGGEVGMKSQFNNRDVTLNVTAYYYIFDDLQVQNFDAAAVQFVTLNAGEVTTKGVDVTLGWTTPVDGLSFSSNLSYLDAQFSKTFETAPGVDLNGREVARAPEFSGNIAFDWAVPLSDALELNLSGNAIYSGSYFTNEDTLTDHRQDSFVTFDAQVAIGHPDGNWKLALIGTNLTDKLWVNTSSGRPFLEPGVGDDLIFTQNRGRQVYVEASFKF